MFNLFYRAARAFRSGSFLMLFDSHANLKRLKGASLIRELILAEMVIRLRSDLRLALDSQVLLERRLAVALTALEAITTTTSAVRVPNGTTRKIARIAKDAVS